MTPKEAKKTVNTETKIMSMIEKIMDKISDSKMQMRIAHWVYQKYFVDKTDVPKIWPSTKPAYPYIPYPEKTILEPYVPNPHVPSLTEISAYAAPFGPETTPFGPETTLIIPQKHTGISMGIKTATTCNCGNDEDDCCKNKK
ncbi:MAG TPA: hypothetical protein VMX17_06820 [Candidatus Glassbacteria bacterium]|nr:hypothetical protein [Candidatus Glassbacteria bacterium]